jgi:hypothetical protein
MFCNIWNNEAILILNISRFIYVRYYTILLFVDFYLYFSLRSHQKLKFMGDQRPSQAI